MVQKPGSTSEVLNVISPYEAITVGVFWHLVTREDPKLAIKAYAKARRIPGAAKWAKELMKAKVATLDALR